MNRPLTQSDLLFPNAAHQLSISTTLSSLKRSALSIHNRLASIVSDSDYVASVSTAYGLPLIANERCGSWYIPPPQKAESVYFKSTDGHTGEWSFSLRRLNLQVFDVVNKKGGCVIVDSTRRGKSMPDALSKTVPIWCCVVNRAIFGEEAGLRELYTPPLVVSASEHAQIETRIETFVPQFLDICRPNIQQLRARIRKPLRPLWVTQGSPLPDTPPTFPDFHPIVLCTASRRVQGAETSEGGYVQGAADDHEAWAHGLTPKVFWSNKDRLLTADEKGLPSLIEELVKGHKGSETIPILITPTSNIYISSTQNLDMAPFDVVISCTPEALTTKRREDLRKQYLHLKCQTGKLGSRDLRTQLHYLPAFFETLPDEIGKVLVTCPTAKDLAVGVALTILCLYTDDEGRVSRQRTGRNIEKKLIKQRLAWITTSNPGLNPSRTTLQSVNALLMPGPTEGKAATIQSGLRKSQLVLVDDKGNALREEPSRDITRAQSNIATTFTSIFTTLQNEGKDWKFARTLTSALRTHPSGTVTGTASFTACSLASTSSNQLPILLYSEEGEFMTSNGLHFIARRKYVYRLKLDANTDLPFIAIHFFDDEKMRGRENDGVGGNGEGIGGLFVEMADLEVVRSGMLGAHNREQHLCAEDLYTASWQFGSSMVNTDIGGEDEETWWTVRYDVTGPKKDYVSETRYTRARNL